MTPILSIQDLTFRRGAVPVLEIADLSLRAGEVLALVGPNGAGKSTLLQVLAGLLPPASGQISLGGTPVATDAQRRAARRRVTLVFQDPLLFDTTVAANLASGLALRGLPKAEREARVARIAARLGLTDLLPRAARTLSGGEAQRTALARALVLEPEVLFLDEPFSALDAPTREGLMADLGAALRETGTAAVLVTHHLAEALRLADSLAVMIDGRIRQRGPVRDVINRPGDEAVAAFVGMESLVEGTVVASSRGVFTLDCGLEGVGEVPVGRRLLAGIRPEHVTLERESHPGSSARNQRPATVTRILPHGPFFRVDLDAGFDLSAFVTVGALEHLAIAPGARLVASFKATAVHVVREG